MSVAERVYRLLLRTYPPTFRHAYEREMLLCFRDHRRQEQRRGVRFWAALCLDTVRSASSLWREQITDIINTGDTTMKAMAILALLAGVFETLNVGVELKAGGFVSRDLLSQLTLILVMLSTVSMLACGVALLRRGQRATVLARLAGLACVVAFAFIGIARPVLSALGMLVGIGFPVALLVFLLVRREDGLSEDLAP